MTKPSPEPKPKSPFQEYVEATEVGRRHELASEAARALLEKTTETLKAEDAQREQDDAHDLRMARLERAAAPIREVMGQAAEYLLDHQAWADITAEGPARPTGRLKRMKRETIRGWVLSPYEMAKGKKAGAMLGFNGRPYIYTGDAGTHEHPHDEILAREMTDDELLNGLIPRGSYADVNDEQLNLAAQQALNVWAGSMRDLVLEKEPA